MKELKVMTDYRKMTEAQQAEFKAIVENSIKNVMEATKKENPNAKLDEQAMRETTYAFFYASDKEFLSFAMESGAAHPSQEWLNKSITISAFGTIIDTAIKLACVASGVGSIGEIIADLGEDAALGFVSDYIISELKKHGFQQLAIIISEGLELYYMVTSPGYYMGKYWDENDYNPNNGRVDF